MKYKYDCRINPDPFVIDFLESKKIKYRIATDTLMFEIYSDTEQSSALLEYINKKGNFITKYSIYTKQEMEEAKWFLLNVYRMGIDTSNTEFTYDAKCPFISTYGMKKHRHLEQINSFVSKKTPKWKTGYNFCSVETGATTRIFCSDYAKEAIIKSDIKGVDFMPVLKGDLKTVTPNVSQLVFKTKLPIEAYKFIGDYTEDVCPFCGRINYCFSEPNCHNVELNTDIIPNGFDAFGSKVIFGWGFGDEPVVISKKFYDLIIKDLKENPKHFSFEPIG